MLLLQKTVSCHHQSILVSILCPAEKKRSCQIWSELISDMIKKRRSRILSNTLSFLIEPSKSHYNTRNFSLKYLLSCSKDIANWLIVLARVVELSGMKQLWLNTSIRMILPNLWWRCTSGLFKRKKLICQPLLSSPNRCNRNVSIDWKTSSLQNVSKEKNQNANKKSMYRQGQNSLIQTSFSPKDWAAWAHFTSRKDLAIIKSGTSSSV